MERVENGKGGEAVKGAIELIWVKSNPMYANYFAFFFQAEDGIRDKGM